MPRVKRGVVAHKRREKLLRYTKGFRWGRKSKSRFAKEALLHAWSRAFRGRKEKKRVFRKLWSVRINAAARAEGLTYGKLIAAFRRRNIRINRKILADLAAEHPAVFKKIVESAR